MTLPECVECASQTSTRWWPVSDRYLCEGCAEHVRDTFALAASLGITGVDLLLAVCDR